MRAKFVALVAAVGLFSSGVNALAAPNWTWTSTSTYIYNVGSRLPLTTIWPGGCYTTNVDQGCTRIQLGSGGDRSYYFMTADESGIQIRWNYNLCWDVLNRNPGDGTPITLATCNGSNTQLWQPYLRLSILEGGEGPFKAGGLLNIGTGKCLDAANPYFPALPWTGASLQIWDCVRTIHDTNWVNQNFMTDSNIWLPANYHK